MIAWIFGMLVLQILMRRLLFQGDFVILEAVLADIFFKWGELAWRIANFDENIHFIERQKDIIIVKRASFNFKLTIMIIWREYFFRLLKVNLFAALQTVTYLFSCLIWRF